MKKIFVFIVMIALVFGGCGGVKKIVQEGGLPEGYKEVADGTISFTIDNATKDTKVQLSSENGNIITPIWKTGTTFEAEVSPSKLGTYSVKFYNPNTNMYEEVAGNGQIIISNVEKTGVSGSVDYVLAVKITAEIKVGQFSEYNEEKGKLTIVIENSVKSKVYKISIEQLDDSIAMSYKDIKRSAARATRATTTLKEYQSIGTGTNSSFIIDIKNEGFVTGTYKLSCKDSNGSTIAINGGEENGNYVIVKVVNSSETGWTATPGLITISEVLPVEEGDTEYLPYTFTSNANESSFYQTFFNITDITAVKTSTTENVEVKRKGSSFCLNLPTTTSSVTVTFTVQASNNLIPLSTINSFKIIKNFTVVTNTDENANKVKTLVGDSVLFSDSSTIRTDLSEGNLKANFSYFQANTDSAVNRIAVTQNNLNSLVWMTNGLDAYGKFTPMSTKASEIVYTDINGTKNSKIGFFSLINKAVSNDVVCNFQATDLSKAYIGTANINTSTTATGDISSITPTNLTISAATVTLRVKVKQIGNFYKFVLAKGDKNPFLNTTSKSILGSIALIKEDTSHIIDGEEIYAIKTLNLKALKSEDETDNTYDDVSFFIDDERYKEFSNKCHISTNKVALIIYQNNTDKIQSQIYIIKTLNDFKVATESEVAEIVNPNIVNMNIGKSIIFDNIYQTSDNNWQYLNGRIYLKNYPPNLKTELNNKYVLDIGGVRENSKTLYRMKLRENNTLKDKYIVLDEGVNCNFFNEDKDSYNGVTGSYYINAAQEIQNNESTAAINDSMINLKTLNNGIRVSGKIIKKFDLNFIATKMVVEFSKNQYFIEETTTNEFSSAKIIANTVKSINYSSYEVLYVNPEQEMEIIPSDLSFRVKMRVAERFNTEGVIRTFVDKFSGFNFNVNTSEGWESAYNKTTVNGVEYSSDDMRMKYNVEFAGAGQQVGQFGQNYEQHKEGMRFVRKASLDKDKTLLTAATIVVGCVAKDVYNNWGQSQKSWKTTMWGSATALAYLGFNYKDLMDQKLEEIYNMESGTWADQFNNNFNTKIDFKNLFKTKFPELYDNDTSNDQAAIERLKTLMSDVVFDPKEINYSNIWSTYIYIDHELSIQDILQVPKAKTVDEIKVRTLQQISKLDNSSIVYAAGYELSGNNPSITSMPEVTGNNEYTSFKKGNRTDKLSKGWYLLQMKTEKIGGGKVDNTNGWAVEAPVNAAVFRAEVEPKYTLSNGTSGITVYPYYESIRLDKNKISGTPFSSVIYYKDSDISLNVRSKKVKR